MGVVPNPKIKRVGKPKQKNAPNGAFLNWGWLTGWGQPVVFVGINSCNLVLKVFRCKCIMPGLKKYRVRKWGTG